MNELNRLAGMLDNLPSDYYDNSPIPNETQMIKDSILHDCDKYKLTDKAIEIIEHNPSVSLDEFMTEFEKILDTPPMELVDADTDLYEE